MSYIASEQLQNLVTSTGWHTVAAQAKYKLSRMIASNDVKGINKVAEEINTKYPALEYKVPAIAED